MNKKRAAVEMKTVWLILSVIFFILVLLTITMRPGELWASTKNFTCDATFEVLLCDLVEEDENDEPWRNGDEEIVFDEFNKALRDQERITRNEFEFNEIEEIFENLYCVDISRIEDSDYPDDVDGDVDYHIITYKSFLDERSLLLRFSEIHSTLTIVKVFAETDDKEEYSPDNLWEDFGDDRALGPDSLIFVPNQLSGERIDGRDILRDKCLNLDRDNCLEKKPIDYLIEGLESCSDSESIEYEIEELDEQDFVNNFNKALRDEEKVTKTNLEGYDITALQHNLDCLARFEEDENDLYLFEGVYEEGTIYLTAMINESDEIVEDTCVKVLKATFSQEEEYNTFTKAKEAYENKDDFRETLKLNERGVCKKEGGFAYIMEESIRATLSKCRG